MAYDVSNGVTSTGVTLFYNSMYVHDGGTADSTRVNGGGRLYVSSGGSATNTTVNSNGWMNVSGGGKADSTEIGSFGGMSVYSGASADGVTVNAGASLCISSGGTALNIVENGGYVQLRDGANATFVPNSFSGVVLTYGKDSATVHSGTTANGTTVNSGGGLCISSGGSASNTTVNSNGHMTVSGGGKADSTVINSFGGMRVCSGASADGVTVNAGGSLYILDDGTALNIVENGGYVQLHDGANVTFVPNSFGGVVLTHDDATVHSGTTANGTTVNSDGRLYVSNGGSANNTAINNGGGMIVSSGGTACGLQITGNAFVSAYAGAEINFDLVPRQTTDAALVNDLAKIGGTPDFTITVLQDQTVGVYALADGAAGFDETVTICTTASVCDTLTVGSKVTLAGQDYTLNLTDALLTLTVSASPAPVISGTAGDLNADGRADVLMAHDAGFAGAWLIQSDQTAAWDDLSTLNPGWEIFGTGRTAPGKETADVYVRSTDNVIGAWTTGDSGEVTGWETVGQFDANTQILGLGDFNGNGQTDLLLRNVNGAVGCYFTDGTGWNYFQSLGDEWQIAAIGDFNGDDRADTVLVHDAGFAGTWLTQSDGTIVWADLDTVSEGFAVAGAGDFDGDGTDDVLLKNGNYYGAWLVEDGSAKAWFGLGDLGNVTVEQIADFDGDGTDDLRIRTDSGDIGALLVRGEGALDWHYYGSVGPEWSTRLAAI